ncbi:hypothetical protein, partial [Serratia marcescens]|uniref:hypothetical protein n=1 Tax=Serratia marcescens TaxID=615 RepID=UPI002812AB10
GYIAQISSIIFSTPGMETKSKAVLFNAKTLDAAKITSQLTKSGELAAPPKPAVSHATSSQLSKIKQTKRKRQLILDPPTA